MSDAFDALAYALRFLNSMAGPSGPRDPWPVPGTGGTLTPEILERALDEMWHPRRPVLPWGHRDLLEDLPQEPQPELCHAMLFTPRESLASFAFPGYFSPVQGPAPLACALEPHPEGTWHHDGKGTWFR